MTLDQARQGLSAGTEDSVSASAPLLELNGVSRNFEGVLAVDNVTMTVQHGELVSIIGPNGAGKTTLFNLITGTDQPTSGTLRFAGRSLAGLRPDQFAALGMARTFQNGRIFGNLSVLDNVLIGAHSRRSASQSGNLITELMTALIPSRSVQGEVQALRVQAQTILGRFGERLLPRMNESANTLSYANRRRVEIARALMLQPRLLLLDEPTAGMNLTETAEMTALIQQLKQEGLTILLIEHKLSLVMQLSDRVIVMDDGAKIADGLPELVRNDPRVAQAYLGRIG